MSKVDEAGKRGEEIQRGQAAGGKFAADSSALDIAAALNGASVKVGASTCQGIDQGLGNTIPDLQGRDKGGYDAGMRCR